ncbi:MAG: CinA family protein, partial [Oscillospiraceae bacterium]|nr:CinA family protein [Oscillospiraceae bacterium]
MGNTAEFELIKTLLDKKATVATAESCTGGMVAARLTSVSGASGAFKYGAVTYCNE